MRPPKTIETSEFRLLRRCCAASFGAGDLLDAGEQTDLDWDRFLRLARRHRVQGLCWKGLEQLQVAAPGQIAARLRSDRQRTAADGLRALAVCRELASASARRGPPLLFLKGLTVGRLAYGDPFLKMGWDVDILVRPADLPLAAELLTELGYAPAVPSDLAAVVRWHRTAKESVWVRDGSPPLELHTGLADNPALLDGLDPFARAPQMVEVVPGIPLPTLEGGDLYAYLTVHGASSAWFRLKWLLDLAALLSARKTDELASLHARAVAVGAGRASAWALLLCRAVFGVGGDCVEHLALQRDGAHRLLLRIGLASLADEREPTGHALGTAAIHLSQLLLKPGPAFAVAEGLRQLRSMMIRA